MRSAWPLVLFVIFAVAMIPWLAVGCGSSSAKASATDGGKDASVVDVVEEPDLDAGPDITQNPNVYPSNHHPIPQLDYNGGPILTHPRVVTITFVGDPHRDSFRDFDHLIIKSAWWQQTAEGFCIDGGAYSGDCVGAGDTVAPEGGAWLPDGSTLDAGDGSLDVEIPYDFGSILDVDGSAANSVQDPDIQKWLALHTSNGDFPAPDDQTLYVIYFPTTTTITIPGGQGQPPSVSCEQFGGYHSYTSSAVMGGLAYAVIPYCDYGQGDDINFQQVTFAVSHELAEASTDPEPTDKGLAFYLVSNDAWEANAGFVGGECGDMCFAASEINSWEESGYNVTRIWDNHAAALSMNPCQPWSPTYYAAALRTVPQMVPANDINGAPHISDGYVFLKRGTSVNVIADVFSQAALPHVLALYAGVDKGTATTDPSDLGTPDDLVTATLSNNQANNGDGIIVTFSAPKNASPEDVRLVIRAALETTDYNDWPVIVHVTD